jgi:uncharacterized protein
MLVGRLQGLRGDACYAYDPASAGIFLAADEAQAVQDALHARPDASEAASSDEGMPAWSLAVHLNHSCNLGCVYCYADGRTSDGSGQAKGAYGGDRSYLLPETLAAGLEKFFGEARAATANLNFLGGEPLLSRSRFVEAVSLAGRIAQATGTAARFEITTNGTRLSPRIVDLLREYDFQVSVSLDGSPDTHDAQRPLLSGRGSYTRVLAGLQLLRARGVPYHVRMTAQRATAGFPADHLALLDVAAVSVSAQFSVYGEDGRRPLDAGETGQLLRHYEAIAFGVACADEQATRIATVTKVVGALLRRSRRNYQCGAGRGYFALTPSGDVFPCHRFAGMSRYLLGNVLDADFRFRPVELFVRRGLQLRPAAAEPSGCQVCFARNVCAGGCPQLAADAGGDLDEMPRFYCEEMRLRVHGAVRGLVRHALGDRRPWPELG